MGDQIGKLIFEEFYVFRYLHLNHRNILLKKRERVNLSFLIMIICYKYTYKVLNYLTVDYL